MLQCRLPARIVNEVTRSQIPVWKPKRFGVGVVVNEVLGEVVDEVVDEVADEIVGEVVNEIVDEVVDEVVGEVAVAVKLSGVVALLHSH